MQHPHCVHPCHNTVTMKFSSFIACSHVDLMFEVGLFERETNSDGEI